ncbi:MAG: hypothetical protein V1917_01710, partial [Candidatus Gottesmanbacteria bacterium]
MTTTDTFIVPPINAISEETATENKEPKKKSGKGKWAILIGLVVLIITLPVAIYYISQQQQLADMRSRATEVYPCHFNGTGDFQTVNGCSGQCGPGITDKTVC